MTTGRAIVQTVFPGSTPAESLSLVRKEKPRPSPGNVVVRMIASAVNPIDLIYIRNGSLARFEDKGAVHGSEGVAIVDEIGEGVTSCRVGERVIPVLFWKYYSDSGEGGWQDYVEVAEEDAVPVPDTMADAVAAQFVINPWTMYGMLLDLQIPEGKYLLQTAAGSVLGRQCIQLAKHWGIKTINIVRRDELKDELISIGADEVINSEKEDITMRVKEITNGEGAYAGIDAVGGTLFKNRNRNKTDGEQVHNKAVQTSQQDRMFQKARVTGGVRTDVEHPRTCYSGALTNPSWQPQEIGELLHRQLSIDNLVNRLFHVLPNSVWSSLFAPILITIIPK